MGKSIFNLNQVEKVYNANVFALAGVDLSIYENDFVAITGKSGSGKSTMLNILGCLDQKFNGKVQFLEKDVKQMSNVQLSEIRNNEIGFIFQMFNLLKDHTALENVALPLLYNGYSPHDANEKAEEFLRMVDMTDRMSHLPKELSGGQQQRVAIARALVNDPSIILADEPTGNLDTKTSAEIMKLIERIQGEGKTIVFITHDMNLAKRAHRVVEMKDGKIIADA